MRRKTQLDLAFPTTGAGEARECRGEGTETNSANADYESRVPDQSKVGSNGEEAFPFVLAENAGPSLEQAGEVFVRLFLVG